MPLFMRSLSSFVIYLYKYDNSRKIELSINVWAEPLSAKTYLMKKKLFDSNFLLKTTSDEKR